MTTTQTAAPLESMHELAGWVTCQRAAELMGFQSADQARKLITRHQVQAMRWDGKALMINKASLLAYRDNRKIGRPPKEEK